MRKIQLFIVVAMCLVGCATPKQMTLFTNTPETAIEPEAPVYTIDPGDMVQVVFYTIIGEGSQPYNSVGTNYYVLSDSTITIPVLGRIRVAGMTTLELAAYLEKCLVGQVKQPIVKVEIADACISVLGEVGSPTRIGAVHPLRFIDVLSAVGGPTKYARLDNVLVQRTEGGVLKSYRINLKEDDLTQSPCYYLGKGDVLYIAPKKAKRTY